MSSDSCPFCSPNRAIVAENTLAYAIRDGFPVSPGHTLVIPRRHVETVLGLTEQETAACWELVRAVCSAGQADGFNIGMNCGAAAGQTVGHAHIHVIPRYIGDVAEPRGGVRHVIPGKGTY